MVYLSLGSNIGEREGQIREAVQRLGQIGWVASASSFYETEPVEFTDQPWFLNCAVALETNLGAPELMKSLLLIEENMGRRRLQDKGPRIIDLDILLFHELVINSEELAVPHPAMQERRFVLEPLAEIAPETRHPILKKTIRELLRELPPGQAVRKMEARQGA